MQIIQSFAKYEGISPYIDKRKSKADYFYLNFYSMLLSYITLQRQYGSVTMFCDKAAYDALIKYIPYDNVEIVENQNDILMWSKYKLDIMKTIGEDFIHVDQDVIVFDDFYKSFIDGKCDVLVQDVVSKKRNFTKMFIYENLDFLKETKILTKPYDGQAFSGGSLGLRKHVQDYYFKAVDIFYDGMVEFGIENIPLAAMILEETLLYLITTENDFKYDYILPQKDVDEMGLMFAGDKIGYLHLWAANKFKRIYIQQLRKELFTNHPQYLDYVIKYEREVMIWKRIFRYIVLPDNYQDVKLPMEFPPKND